jgi:hypothetical protein
MFGLPPTLAGPTLAQPPPPAPFPTITSIGPFGALQGVNSGATSTTWPTANTAFFMPFAVPLPVVAQQLFLVNGGAVSGNFDVGIYDAQGTRLVSLGSTAQSGTTALQAAAIASLQLAPGLYYLGLALDNTTGAVLGHISNAGRATGARMLASAFPLPARAAWGAPTSSNYWYCGFATRGFV